MTAAEQLIDDVMSYIYNHKDLATRRLFPTASEGYIEQWIQREVFEYWRHLDSGNRVRLIRDAVEYYGEPQNHE